MIPAFAALPPMVLAGLAGLLGLVAGSFIATLVLRWEAGGSVFGRSRCDGCALPLRWADLIPLVSWLFLRGRCRACGAQIVPLHPLVETASALIAVVAVLLFPGIAGWLLALLGWMLLPLALLDARSFWLPDALVAPLAIAGLLLAGPMMDTSMTDRFAGALIAGGVLGGLRTAFRLLRGREGMGAGDPKLAAALGAWLGWAALPLLLLIASVGGILWALATHQRSQPIADRNIPFGTFLAASAWCVVPLWRQFIL